MRITILYMKLDATPAINQYVEEKIGSLAKFLRRWDEESELVARVELARITLHHHKGEVFMAEVTLPLPGKVLRGEFYDQDVRIAVDGVRDILKREIEKYKEKKIA